MTCCTRYN